MSSTLSTADLDVFVPHRRSIGEWASWLVNARSAQVIALIVVIGLIGVIKNPALLNFNTLSIVLVTAMVTAFAALGQTFVLIARGIDLSVSPIVGLAAVMVGFPAQNSGMRLWEGVLLGILVGVVLGAGNGLLVAVAKLPPIIATLATFSIYGGLQFIRTRGDQVNAIPDEYTRWGIVTNRVAGMPPLFWAGVIVMLILVYVLQFSNFGRTLYAVGANASEAKRLGISTQRMVFMAYVICGLMAGLAGVVYLCRTGSADSITGTATNENLFSIAAALVGGATLTGGRGTAQGAFLGAIFLAVVTTVMGAIGIPPVWQPAGVGILIVLAVLADTRTRRKV